MSRKPGAIQYLELKRTLKSFSDVQRICRHLDRYLGDASLRQINGDLIWSIVQGELKKGNKPATVNRYLATVRSLLRMARDEWQWIDTMPKIRLLTGEVERDRWLTREEAEKWVSEMEESDGWFDFSDVIDLYDTILFDKGVAR